MKFETADAFRQFGSVYLSAPARSMLPSHRKAIFDIANCRTESMGGHRYHCNDCGRETYVYHACRNRHCPACHKDQIARWLDARALEMLPCDYFHVVVTVPDTLRKAFRNNQKLLYSMLMKNSAESLLTLAADKKLLGAKVGILSVLHTWRNDLQYHPHTHMLVTGGGIDNKGNWIGSKKKYLVPVRALSKLIKGRFRARLKKQDYELYKTIPASTWSKDWVVYSKHCKRDSSFVLKYLGRYVFRVAITNNRIIDIDDKYVTFKFKDRKAGKWRIRKLPGCDFIGRFLQHTLPKGFHKIRYYGIWHSSSKLNAAEIAKMTAISNDFKTDTAITAKPEAQEQLQDNVRCRHCGSDNTRLVEKLFRGSYRGFGKNFIMPRCNSPSLQSSA